jgi:hypothetical protein
MSPAELISTMNETPENTPESTPENPVDNKASQQGGEPVAAASPGPQPGRTPLSAFPTLIVQFWDKVLKWVSTMMNIPRFEGLSRLAVVAGNWAILATSLLALLLGLVLAIKLDSFRLFLGGIGFVILLSVLHYSATKFIDSGRKLIEASPTRVSTYAFPSSLALISLVLSLVVLLGSLVAAVQLENFNFLLQGVAGFVILIFLVWLAVNPELTATRIGDSTSAGEEAISVISFLMKALLRMVPILFGVVSVLAGVALLVALVQSFGSGLSGVKAMQSAMFGGVLGLWGAGLPFIGFLVFILYYLIIDVIRAILEIPRKLERRGSE